jgi:cytochrome P450
VSAGDVEGFQFLGRGMIEDPHAGYEALRARGGIVWSAAMRSWLVVGYDAARTVLESQNMVVPDVPDRLRRTAGKARKTIPAMERMTRHIPFFANGTDHARLRKGMGATLGVAKSRFATTATEAARRLLVPLRQAGGGDLAGGFCARLHVEVAAELFGVPEADRANLSRLAELGRTADDAVPMRVYEVADTSIVTLSDYMLALWREQRRQGQTTLLTELGRRFEPDPLDDPEISLATAAAALLALGRDTLSGTLTLGLAALFDANDGRLTPKLLSPGHAIAEDLARHASSVQYAKRIATHDIMVDGTQVKAGDHIVVLLAGVNRDPARFDNAGAICPHRAGWSLAFSLGAHSCLGAPMARYEIAAALDALSELPGLTARSGRRYGPIRAVRGYEFLPATIS